MKVYQDQNYSFLPASCQAGPLSQSEAVVFSLITPEIKQEKIQRPNLTLIQVVDKENWTNIFKEKIHLTIEPAGNYFHVYSLDGADYAVGPQNLTDLITKLLTAQFYKTKIESMPEINLDEQQQEIIDTYPQYMQHGQSFGTFALRLQNGSFLTSTRGKKQGLRSISQVIKVDHKTLTVHANTKATLNAPLLDKVLELNPHLNYLLHGHELAGKVVHDEYEFAGTTGDLKFASIMKSGEMILLPHHGFLVGFETFSEIQKFIKESIWNNYRAQFPSRYFQSGYFDSELAKILASKKSGYLKILDIGGGEQGTIVLNQPSYEVFYLDPYVKNPPKWVKGRIEWSTKEQFDLIVARGCVNYFTPEQLEKIPLMLKKRWVIHR